MRGNHTIEARIKMSKSKLGKKRGPMSDESKRKLSLANKGKKMSPESRRKMSASATGRKMSEETRRKMSESGKRRYLSVEERIRTSKFHRGSKSHFWKGGVTEVNKIIRSSIEYTLWRESVFVRDDYTCIFCGKRGVALHADHIKPFALFPELRFSIDNGRTLCIDCHKNTDTYLGRCHSYKKNNIV